MTVLTAADRKRIPAGKFGIPSKRAYPMPDKEHARLAKAFASREHARGALSAEAKSHIDRMANHILGHSDPDHDGD